MTEDDPRTLADERRRLLGRLQLERKQLLRNIEYCRIRDIDRPFIAEWSLKDIVGHLASWEAEVVTALRELREGKRPALLDFAPGAINKWNHDHVERKRDLEFSGVFEQLRGGRTRLLEEISAVADDELTAEGTVSNRLVLSVIDHERAHWHEIAAKLAGMAGARSSGPQSVPEEVASGTDH